MADTILSNAEIEYILDNFKPSNLDEIGSTKWFKNLDKLCKLYQVAVIEGKTEGQERIKDCLSVISRISDFVKELITLSVWKENVLPELLNFTPKPEHSLPTYLILYCEVMIVGFLEAMLFHGELIWELGDMCLDLVEYGVHKITQLDPQETYLVEIHKEVNPLKEINHYRSAMNFSIGTSCITILRYIAENFDKLSLNIASKLYTTYDVPLIIARLLDNGMWSYKKDGKFYKYVENNWREWKVDDPVLSSTECQVWLLLRQLLLNEICDTVYYYNNYRKEYLSKLTRLLHDNVIDQLSPLADLKIWLHRLSISDYQQNTASNPLIMELSETFANSLTSHYSGKWKTIAMEKAGVILYPQHDEIVKLAKGFASGLDRVDLVAENINSCCLCFSKALKRCSKCHKVWYCSRKCQVEHWKIHKLVCGK